MEQYIIKGGNPLVGEVEIGGAKNAALAILAAGIMTDETVQIDNLPDVNDVNVMLEAIEGIGAMVQRIDRHTVKINGSTIGDFNIEYDYIKKIISKTRQKLLRSLFFRIFKNFLRSPLFQNTSSIHKNHLAGHISCKRHFMCDDDHRRLLVCKTLDHFQHFSR